MFFFYYPNHPLDLLTWSTRKLSNHYALFSQSSHKFSVSSIELIAEVAACHSRILEQPLN